MWRGQSGGRELSDRRATSTITPEGGEDDTEGGDQQCVEQTTRPGERIGSLVE